MTCFFVVMVNDYSGGSRGGARGPAPTPLLLLDRTEARMAENKFFKRPPPPPYLKVSMTPSPPPLSLII